MKSVIIRTAALADCQVLADFNLRLAFETESLTLDAATVLEGVRRVVSDSSKGQYFVAVDGREVVGCTLITYEWSDWRNSNIWWFQSVYVRSDYRKHGVFRALHAHVLQAAKLAGASQLRLYVEEHNTAAIATYQRLGMSFTPYKVVEQPLAGHRGD